MTNWPLEGGTTGIVSVDRNLRGILKRGGEVAAQAQRIEKEGVSSSLESLKIIRGIINTGGAGSIVKGSGFSIVRNGTGDVTITFTATFKDVPSVVATVGETGAVSAIKHFEKAATASTARLLVFLTATGAGQDSVFHFTAVGPR